jgi:hypothetical protein
LPNKLQLATFHTTAALVAKLAAPGGEICGVHMSLISIQGFATWPALEGCEKAWQERWDSSETPDRGATPPATHKRHVAHMSHCRRAPQRPVGLPCGARRATKTTSLTWGVCVCVLQSTVLLWQKHRF